MASDSLQSILKELPHLDDDGIRDLYHEAVSYSNAFHAFLQGRLAAAPGETAVTWLERRLASLARDQLLLLLVAVADGGFDDALRFMAHRLGLAADRRRMPPPPLLFGLPIRTAARDALAPHPGTGFADSGQSGFGRLPGVRPDPSVGYNDSVDPSDYRVAFPNSVGPWVQTPQISHDGVSELKGQAPPPQSPLDVLAGAATAMAPLESPAPAPTLNTTPLRHPATTGIARFDPLQRTAGCRRPRSRLTSPAPTRPTSPPKPSPDLPGNPGLDWRPRSPPVAPRRPAPAPIAELLPTLPQSPQRCVRCGVTYLEAQNSGRRTCRFHAAYPVADAGMAAAWGAAAAAGVAAEPHFRPSLFARADLAGAFVWPCCGRRGGGPGPDPGCRAGIHISEGTRLWRAPQFHGWERYGRQGREEGEEG